MWSYCTISSLCLIWSWQNASAYEPQLTKIIIFTHSVKYWKWSDMWPSMVTHTRNLCSAFNPSKVHTHNMNTHPEQWADIYAATPGEQLRVRCLAQGHLSRGIEGGESAVHSLPPPTIPARPETRTRNLWITSPDSLAIRPYCAAKSKTNFNSSITWQMTME